MSNTDKNLLLPDSPESLREAINAANHGGTPLEIIGNGSKREYGRLSHAEQDLSTRAISGIVDYQPQELLVVAKAGTALKEIEAALAEKGQMLAFEPPHWGEATLGGVLACNLSGPRRIRAGAARDHLLGFQAVTGAGDLVRGGGKVVKNVTGYDLSKLMCGSFGTLAVMNEVCVKVLPRPQAERTVIAIGSDIDQGLQLMLEAARSSHEVSGLAHLPMGTHLPAPVSGLHGVGDGLTAVRLEGPQPSVVYRSEMIVDGIQSQTIYLEGEESDEFWRALRELEPLAPSETEHVWRISVPPSRGLDCARALRLQGDPRLFLDWGGGLVWAVLHAEIPPQDIHTIAQGAGGHAQRVRGPMGSTPQDMAFSTPADGVHRLNQNLKRAFDPNNILNPGRIQGDL